MPQPPSHPMTSFIKGLETIDDLVAALAICDYSFKKEVELKMFILSKLNSASFSDYAKIVPALNRLCRLNDYDSELSGTAVYYNWVIGDYKEASQLGTMSITRHGINNSILRNMVFLYLVSGEHDKLKWLLEQAKQSDLDIAYWSAFFESLQQGAIPTVRHPQSKLEFRFALSCYSTQSMEAALHHWQGKFCEENELALLSSLCRNQNVLEIGCLVGNHTIFMMLQGKAKSITCVDIDARSCMMTRLNARLNLIPEEAIRIIHAKAGKNSDNQKSDPVDAFFLQSTTVSDYGLIKIDIDGGELEFFNASLEYLELKRPVVFAEVQDFNLLDVHSIFKSMRYSHKVVDVRQSGEANILFIP